MRAADTSGMLPEPVLPGSSHDKPFNMWNNGMCSEMAEQRPFYLPPVPLLDGPPDCSSQTAPVVSDSHISMGSCRKGVVGILFVLPNKDPFVDLFLFEL